MLLHYKNFTAKIEYISRIGSFYGEVINYNDILIVFLAENQKDLMSAFIIAAEQLLMYQHHPKTPNFNSELYLVT